MVIRDESNLRYWHMIQLLKDHNKYYNRVVQINEWYSCSRNDWNLNYWHMIL